MVMECVRGSFPELDAAAVGLDNGGIVVLAEGRHEILKVGFRVSAAEVRLELDLELLGAMLLDLDPGNPDIQPAGCRRFR